MFVLAFGFFLFLTLPFFFFNQFKMSEPTTGGIKVVDAEPQSTNPSSPTSAGMNPNVVLNNALDGFANLSSKFNPFAQKLGKGFGQVRQVS